MKNLFIFLICITVCISIIVSIISSFFGGAQPGDWLQFTATILSVPITAGFTLYFVRSQVNSSNENLQKQLKADRDNMKNQLQEDRKSAIVAEIYLEKYKIIQSTINVIADMKEKHKNISYDYIDSEDNDVYVIEDLSDEIKRFKKFIKEHKESDFVDVRDSEYIIEFFPEYTKQDKTLNYKKDINESIKYLRKCKNIFIYNNIYNKDNNFIDNVDLLLEKLNYLRGEFTTMFGIIEGMDFDSNDPELNEKDNRNRHFLSYSHNVHDISKMLSDDNGLIDKILINIQGLRENNKHNDL